MYVHTYVRTREFGVLGVVCNVVLYSWVFQHVMRFAEVTQEVQTERQTMATPAVGLTPGRRRANLLYKAALHKGGSAEGAEGGSNQPVVHPFHLALPLLCVDRVSATLVNPLL